ncbi:MAG: methyltransferase domain-containing protein [Desulfobacteraceae bacterium]|nr:methyltransferase domain-containing protein [Desulfobacteraceae bacterium]
MKLKHFILGIITFLPGLNKFKAKGTGGTDSARYCYSVWLRHMVMAKKNGLNPYPGIVAELGPGDSLGIGMAALISGCERYFAFDVVEHSNTEKNLQIFDELVSLFQNRTAIPGEEEFPEVKPYLDDYNFPADIYDEGRLSHALEESRLKKIRAAVGLPPGAESLLSCKTSWYDDHALEKESLDMIYSQAVLEHIDDLRNAYRAMRLWLKPEGYISHQIDFKSHGTADEWNGHWMYSDLMWKLMRGKRPYLINREPHSAHLAILKEQGFKLLCDKKTQSKSNYTLDDLSQRFKSITDEDLITSGAFIQAIKIG